MIRESAGKESNAGIGVGGSGESKREEKGKRREIDAIDGKFWGEINTYFLKVLCCAM